METSLPYNKMSSAIDVQLCCFYSMEIHDIKKKATTMQLMYGVKMCMHCQHGNH